MDCSLPGSSSMGFSRQEYWSGVPLPSPVVGGGGAAQLISLSVFVSFPPTMFNKLSIQIFKKKSLTSYFHLFKDIPSVGLFKIQGLI